jgi:hypothetical protein
VVGGVSAAYVRLLSPAGEGERFAAELAPLLAADKLLGRYKSSVYDLLPRQQQRSILEPLWASGTLEHIVRRCNFSPTYVLLSLHACHPQSGGDYAVLAIAVLPLHEHATWCCNLAVDVAACL